MAQTKEAFLAWLLEQPDIAPGNPNHFDNHPIAMWYRSQGYIGAWLGKDEICWSHEDPTTYPHLKVESEPLPGWVAEVERRIRQQQYLVPPSGQELYDLLAR